MDRLNNVIGITGHSGSGKSYFGEYLSNVTGIEYVEFDKCFHEILNWPVVKFFIERKTEGEFIAGGHAAEYGITKEFSRLEILAFKTLANLKLKQVLKKHDKPIIIDYFALPELAVAHRFGANYHVVSNEDIRIKKLVQRAMGRIDLNKAEHFASRTANIVDFSKLQYTDVFENDYKTIPPNLAKAAQEIKNKFNPFKKI